MEREEIRRRVSLAGARQSLRIASLRGRTCPAPGVPARAGTRRRGAGPFRAGSGTVPAPGPAAPTLRD